MLRQVFYALWIQITDSAGDYTWKQENLTCKGSSVLLQLSQKDVFELYTTSSREAILGFTPNQLHVGQRVLSLFCTSSTGSMSMLATATKS